MAKYSYTYDNGGNITAANGHTYTYGDSQWKDLLTAYDGQSITYDGIGNPTSYYNGTRWNFTWEHGRELVSASNGTGSISYSYDADGLRTSKTVGGVVYNYYYVGSQLARMTYGTTVLDFFYDATGVPVAMRQGSTTSTNYTVYYYITNLQGDVIRLVDVNGSTAAYYEYDPYGKAIQAAGSHATINPLRYRGYVYDTETGFYYLQSRYYDPQIGRFINADVYAATGQGLLGNNMFAYCNNNPVCSVDYSGEFPVFLYPIIKGVINNGKNALYYALSDGESDATSSSYQNEYVSQWDRIEYTKQQTNEPYYNVNAWRYNSEYSLHEYGWYLTGWAYDKDIPIISDIAESFANADVSEDSWDDKWYVNVATFLWGLLGL